MSPVSRSRRRRLLVVGSVLFGLMPVTFGIIRAISTGDDLRYIWLAGAAILGSMVVMPFAAAASGPVRVSLWRALGAILAGATCAGVTAILMGATAGPGVAIVAVSFGLCTGTSAVFASLARQPELL
jgi:hypothetical protein